MDTSQQERTQRMIVEFDSPEHRQKNENRNTLLDNLIVEVGSGMSLVILHIKRFYLYKFLDNEKSLMI